MDLEEFVSSVLLDLAAGVKKANDTHAQKDRSGLRPFGIGVAMAQKTPTSVDFDIAITARSSKEAGGKVGARLWVADAGVDGKTSQGTEHVSRVKFSVGIAKGLT